MYYENQNFQKSSSFGSELLTQKYFRQFQNSLLNPKEWNLTKNYKKLITHFRQKKPKGI
jgi:hypothetical protein